MSAILLLFSAAAFIPITATFFLQTISVNQLNVKLEGLKSSSIHHGDKLSVELRILDNLVYEVPDGVLVGALHEVHFFSMGDIRIPCYADSVSISFKINDETVAASHPLSIFDLAASYQSLLPLELFDSDHHANGWILISSNEDQCFNGLQTHYISQYSGVSRITISRDEYNEQHARKKPETNRPEIDDVQTQNRKKPTHRIKTTTSFDWDSDINETYLSLYDETTTIVPNAAVSTDKYTTTEGSSVLPLEAHFAVQEQVFTLHQKMGDGSHPTPNLRTLQFNHTKISISQHVIDDVSNVTNTTSLLNSVCSDFVDIGDTFWNNDFIHSTLQNTSSVECVDVESFANGMNESVPNTVSLFLLNGSNATALDPISNNITNTENNCDPIVVHLNWNANNEHDADRYIPQCVYHSSIAWSSSDESINDECVPIYHDNKTVQCACQYFGSYSTSTQKNFMVNLQETIGNFDPFAVIVSCVYLVLLFIFLHEGCRSYCCRRINDVPLVSLEVYLPNRQRHRMWIITREGRTHFLLRYKFEKSTNKNCKKLWHIFRHFVFNDGLILPFCKRERGSNYYTLERLLNLFWLILAILVVTEILTACNNHITPEYCQYDVAGYIGGDSYCMKANEITIAFVFVILLCSLHFIHRLIFERIHPNKLQMDLHALALLELKRFHKQWRSPSMSPHKLIKNRYSKLEDQTATNQSVSVSNFVQDAFKSVWSNFTNAMNPKYDTPADQNTFNEHDIESTMQYMQEIKKHRHSIIESGQTESFEIFDYYYDGTTNDHMLQLDYGSGTGNDGDIEEDEPVELELRYVELDTSINENNARRYSQECNRYNIAQLNLEQHAQTIDEKDESDESDESVLTAILSADSKLSSRSSSRPESVNSMSFDSPPKPNKGTNNHDRSNSRQSVSVHDSEEPDEEEKMMAPMQRNHSYSLEFESPSKSKRSTARTNNKTTLMDSNDHKSPQITQTQSSTDNNASLFETPTNNTPNCNAPQSSSPLPDLRPPVVEDITPAPSPRTLTDSAQVKHEDHHHPITPTPIRVNVDETNANQEVEEVSTVFIHEKTENNTNFYVHVSPPADANRHARKASQDTCTPFSNDTFIIKSSDSEQSESGEDEHSESSRGLRSPTQPTNDTENINSNAMKTSPDSLNMFTKTINIIDQTITAFAPVHKAQVSEISTYRDDDSLSSVSTMSVTVGTLNSIDPSSDIVPSKTKESIADIKHNEKELSAALNWEQMDNSFVENEDMVVSQAEPSAPQMNAPRPMLNYSSPNRQHVHSNSYSYHHPPNSRTDLQLDATGDDTTTSASDDNEVQDALESSSGGDTMEIYDALSETDPFANHNNSSQGSSPSPIKNVDNRSSDFYNEIQQRKTAMDAHYVIDYRWRIWMCWYFALFIGVLVVLLVVIGSVAFDKTPKYRNTPMFNKYSFLRNECRNTTRDMINDEYLMQYGQPFVETLHFRYSDGTHWIVLSLISIAAMFVVYPLILWINAALLIFRHSYYENKGVDPLFICGFCPIYQRYSSPNAPQLSSVLDPNNLYLFNHNISPGMTPNAINSDKQAMFAEKSKEEKEDEEMAKKIAFGLVTVDEEDYFEEVNDSESKHSMVQEPQRCILPQSDESNEDEKDASDENDGDNDGFCEARNENERRASDVLKATLLPLNLTANSMFSPGSGAAENSSQNT